MMNQIVKPKILAIIPARGNSKGIPRKNIKLLCGKPLIAYTIEQSNSSKLIDETIVSTDDKEIKKISIHYGSKVIDRPAEISTDNANMESCISHVLESVKADIVILLQPTSPLRKISTINNAIKIFLDNFETYDSLIPVFPIESKIGKIRKNRYIPNYPLGSRRQDLERLYKECGTIFIFKTAHVGSKNMFGERIMPFVISDYEESIDIDTLDDLKIAEFFMRSKNDK